MVSITLPFVLLESVCVPSVVVFDAFVELGTVILDSPVVVSNICVCPVLSVVSVKRETVVTSSPVVVPDSVVCLELSDMSLEIVKVVKSSKNNYRY